MTAMSHPATAHRRAALAVHALLEQDQRWLLDTLDPILALALAPLLAELRSLGIPSDSSLLRELASAPVQPDGPTAVQRLDQLAPHEVEALARLLATEPAILTARLLSSRTWPWASDLVARLEAGLAREVLALEAPPCPPRLGKALCETIVARLAACAGPLDAPGQVRWSFASPRFWTWTRA